MPRYRTQHRALPVNAASGQRPAYVMRVGAITVVLALAACATQERETQSPPPTQVAQSAAQPGANGGAVAAPCPIPTGAAGAGGSGSGGGAGAGAGPGSNAAAAGGTASAPAASGGPGSGGAPATVKPAAGEAAAATPTPPQSLAQQLGLEERQLDVLLAGFALAVRNPVTVSSAPLVLVHDSAATRPKQLRTASLDSGTNSGGGSGNGKAARLIPSGKDDDIIARRLRRAAELETDPALRAKLWQEYLSYRQYAHTP